MSQEDRAYSYIGTTPPETIQVSNPVNDLDAANKGFVLTHNELFFTSGTNNLTADDAWKNISNRGAGTSTAVIFNLPPAATVIGRSYFFTKVDAGNFTIKASGSDTIHDTTSTSISNTTSETFAHIILKSIQLTGTPTARWSVVGGLLSWTTSTTTFFFGVGSGGVGSGINFKKPVRLATTVNITDLATGAPDTVDGIPVNANDRILVKNQTTASKNGVYIVNNVGTGSDGVWARTTDFDEPTEVVAGSLIIVEEGNNLDNTAWMLTTNNPIAIGTTNLIFSQFPSAHDILYPLQSDNVASAESVTISAGRQLIVAESFDIAGTLTIDAGGKLYILP